MAKPGKWRTITPQLYAEIKAASHEVKHGKYKYNDRAVMQRFGIGKTTMQYIRNTKDYADYCRRTDKNLVPQPPFISSRKYKTKDDNELMPILDYDEIRRQSTSEHLDRKAEKAANIVGLTLLIIIVAFLAFVVFAIIGALHGN